MTNEDHSINIPTHLTEVEIVGQIGGYRHARQIMSDKLESWLDEHVSYYAVSYHTVWPILIVYSDEHRALIKLTWGF